MEQARNSSPRRSTFLDIWKLMAIIFMVIFHIGYDMHALAFIRLDLQSFFWYWFPRLIVFMFLFASGTSLYLAHGKKFQKKKFWYRWAQVSVGAMAVSVVTYFLFPRNWVYFGILHCISVSLLLGLVFLRQKCLSYLAIALIVLSSWYFDISFEKLSSFTDIKAMDYIPIYPWFAIYLLGISLGPKILEKINQRPKTRPFISWTAKHSLSIYLIHQPVIYGVLLSIKKLAS